VFLSRVLLEIGDAGVVLVTDVALYPFRGHLHRVVSVGVPKVTDFAVKLFVAKLTKRGDVSRLVCRVFVDLENGNTGKVEGTNLTSFPFVTDQITVF